MVKHLERLLPTLTFISAKFISFGTKNGTRSGAEMLQQPKHYFGLRIQRMFPLWDSGPTYFFATPNVWAGRA